MDGGGYAGGARGFVPQGAGGGFGDAAAAMTGNQGFQTAPLGGNVGNFQRFGPQNMQQQFKESLYVN